MRYPIDSGVVWKAARGTTAARQDAVGALVAVVLASDAKFQAAISERTISNDRGPKEPKGQL
jgi:hypothetical protein